jgi:hypothetical protein
LLTPKEAASVRRQAHFLGPFFHAGLLFDGAGDSMALADAAIKLANAGDVGRKRADDRGFCLLAMARDRR